MKNIFNFFIIKMDENLYNELFELYHNRKRKTMEPTPSCLFFLKEGAKIAIDVSNENGGGTPDKKEVFERVKFEWKRLKPEEKIVYNKIAERLGYKLRKKLDIEMNKIIDEKIEKSLGSFSFFN
jgi:hypothetical protein